jgi:hypothetical protein
VPVLCLTWAEQAPLIVEQELKRASKWLGFFVNVPFWSARDLTLNQRAWTLMSVVTDTDAGEPAALRISLVSVLSVIYPQ